MEIHLEEQARKRSDCPYCKGRLEAREATWPCPTCSTVHHADCAAENGGCTVLGCAAAAPRRAAAGAHPTAVAATQVRGVPARTGRPWLMLAPMGIFVVLFFGWVLVHRLAPSEPVEDIGDRWQRQRREREQHARDVKNAFVSAMLEVARSENRGEPAAKEFNRALDLYNEACALEYRPDLRTPLRSVASGEGWRLEQLMTEIRAGRRR